MATRQSGGGSHWMLLAGLGLVVLLGLTVMAGWWLRIPPLVQVLPGSVPMQFNTALCFLLCGLGTLALEGDRVREARILGAAVFLIAVLTLMEYLFQLEFPLDQLFARHWLTTRSTHPGRMATSTAIAFFLYSFPLLSGKQGRATVHLALVSSLLGAQVVLLGATSLAGYVTGSEDTYTWVQLTRMAVHTALGFMVLGLCGLGTMVGHIRANQPRRIWWKPFWIGQTLCLIGVLSWHFGKNQEAVDRLKTMHTILSTMRHEIELTMDVRQDALRRLILRGRVFQDQPQLWEGVSSDLLDDFFALRGIFLLDARGKVLSSVTSDGSVEEAVTSDWLATGALERLDSNFRVVAVLPDARYVLGRWMPPGGEAADRLLVVMDLTEIFGGITEFNLLQYGLLVYDADRQVFPPGSATDFQDPEFKRVEEPMDFYGRELTLQLRPLKPEVAITSLGAQEIELAMSFVLACLAMLLAYQMRIQRERAAVAEDLNRRLEREVSARKAAELKLREYNRKLRESNEDLESFAYVASHDLQEPLRKIRTFGDRLVERCGDQLGDRGKDYLARMTAASARMSLLIEDLLAFSRVGTRAQPMRATDLNEVVSQVLDALQLAIQEAEAEIEVAELPTVHADASQMHQLFQNLIGNALKFRDNERKARIRIDAETVELHAAPAVRVRVRDNGIGIEPEYYDKIFEVFTRLHGRTEYAGSGIGLSVCKKIVERHNGEIRVESVPGVGSSFYVTLPIDPNPPSP